jgi:hypothetical protein
MLYSIFTQLPHLENVVNVVAIRIKGAPYKAVSNIPRLPSTGHPIESWRMISSHGLYAEPHDTRKWNLWNALQPWRWRQHASPKRWLLPTNPHGDLTQKDIIRLFTAVNILDVMLHRIVYLPDDAWYFVCKEWKPAYLKRGTALCKKHRIQNRNVLMTTSTHEMKHFSCYCCDGVRLCLCGDGPLTGPLSIPRMIWEWIWSSGGMILTGKTEGLGGNTCPTDIFHRKSHMGWAGRKLGPPRLAPAFRRNVLPLSSE